MVAQVVERRLEGEIGHTVALGPRARQEVRRISVEPRIAGIGPPQPEASIRSLIEQHPVDGLLDADCQVICMGKVQRLGHIGKIKQRHRPAGQLFGAAIGVAVEHLQKPRRVEAG